MHKKNIPTGQSKVTSIVLTWNSSDFIEKCLASLQSSSHRTDILVVDNDSSDHTRELIAEKFPEIKVINSGANLGYAGGNNFAMKIALKEHPDYLFIFNPDATVHPDTIGLLVHRMEEEPSLAVASPIIYNAGLDTISYAGSTINWNDGTTPHEGYNQINHGQFAQKKYTERANGCAMILRTSAIEKVGLMDENYFLYYEETDWSVRFEQAGYGIGLVPEAKVWHQSSSSTGGAKSPLYQYYMTRNKLYFMNKYRPKRVAYVMLRSMPNIMLQLASTARRSGLRKSWRSTKAFALAYCDYLRGRYGMQPIP